MAPLLLGWPGRGQWAWLYARKLGLPGSVAVETGGWAASAEGPRDGGLFRDAVVFPRG